jgi:VanZ family protein
MATNRNFRYWIPAVLWMVLIFWMSTGTFSAANTSLIVEPLLRFLIPSITEKKIALIHGLIRKLGHVTEYFILGILLFRAFRSSWGKRGSLRWAFLSSLIIALYAATDEFHQSFVYSRTASLLDVGIDTSAGLLAQGFNVIWDLIRQRGHRR